MNKIMITAVFLVVSGCSTIPTGAVFSSSEVTAKQGVGTVVFYRPHQSNFLGLNQPIGRWAIAGNDKTITALGDSTYSKVELAPGKYKFHAQTYATDTIEDIEVKPGKVQYVKTFSRGFGGGVFTYIIFKEVDEQAAQADLQSLVLQINPENWDNTNAK